MRLNPLTSPCVSEGGPIVTAAKGLCWWPLTPEEIQCKGEWVRKDGDNVRGRVSEGR